MSALTLCRLVKGCVHPPRHQGPCEIGSVPRAPISKQTIGAAVTFLDQQHETAQLAARVADELMIIMGANSVIFEGGLNRDALAVLVTAKCGRAANGSRVAESTVRVVLEALANIGEFLNAPGGK